MNATTPRSMPTDRRSPRRRGVTLVEMLVVVALVVLMMTILVQIFQSATGAMSASKATADLDVQLRQLDSMIRSDLNGSTAKMTPPNDPALKMGYFEYGENSPADAQGEDTDDYLAFTVKAPEGQVFTARQWLSSYTGSVQTINQAVQPLTITSQTAEIIYFLRNGNLYRRVFLVAPDRGNNFYVPTTSQNLGSPGFQSSIFGFPLNVSWLGMNEISCRPGIASLGGNYIPIPNDLGDLTNRENRAFRPRFCNDFNIVDGIPDDNNGDGINDYYPTLYYDGIGHSRQGANGQVADWMPNSLIFNTAYGHEQDFPPNTNQRIEQGTANSYDIYAFPFIYPGMYSVPDGASVSGSSVTPPANGLGLRHGLLPANVSGVGLVPNHGPIANNDNLPIGGNQTWWGFPTWRETMAGTSSGGGAGWLDPISLPNRNGHHQAIGLRPFAPTTAFSLTNANFLPPIFLPNSNVPPPSFDGAGSSSFVAAPLTKGANQPIYPDPLWDDDLIMTGVRSFNVRAYDINAPLYNATAANGSYTNGPFSAGYQDLGYGVEHGTGASFYAYGPAGNNVTTTPASAPWQSSLTEPMGFGHSGRIPPLYTDYRVHPRRPVIFDPGGSGNLVPNVVGDMTVGTIRLNRVWDSWSTDYTNAPDSDVFLNSYSATSQSIYPSFPAPYPSPLRGIEIQIRVTDPRGQLAKPLTIRHDFTDKL